MKRRYTLRMLPLLFLFVNLISVHLYAAEKSDVKIKLDGLYQSLTVTPMTENNELIVGAEEYFKLIGSTFNYDGFKRLAIATKGSTTVQFTITKTTALINDKEKKLTTAPVLYNSMVMVPLKFATEAFGGKLEFDEKNNTMNINTGKKTISVLNIKVPVSDTTTVLTYDEALEEALRANSTLATLAESVTYMQELRQDTLDLYHQAAPAGFDKTVVSLIRGVNAYEDEINKVPFSEKIIVDTTEYMIRNALVNISSYLMDIQTVQDNMKQQARNISNIKLKQSLGMASEADLKKANLEHEQSKANLNMLNMSLRNERYSLNKILSRGQDEDIFIDFEPAMTPVKISTIEAYTSNMLLEDPSIKMKEIDVQQAKYKLDTTTSDLNENKLQLESNYNIAQRDLNDTIKTRESSIYKAYNNLNQLLEKQKSLEIDLQKAIDNYNNMVTNYQAGLLTMNDLDNLKLVILNAEVQLEKNKNTYWNLIYGFEHPYLLAQ